MGKRVDWSRCNIAAASKLWRYSGRRARLVRAMRLRCAAVVVLQLQMRLRHTVCRIRSHDVLLQIVQSLCMS